jgi:hypothetical protein
MHPAARAAFHEDESLDLGPQGDSRAGTGIRMGLSSAAEGGNKPQQKKMTVSLKLVIFSL